MPNISTELNRQIVDSDLVELFMIQNPDKTAPAASAFFCFTNYHTTVYLRDKESPYTHRAYTPFPIAFSGWEQKSEGAYARPNIQVANILDTLSTGLGTFKYEDLLGLKLIRRKTLAKYLDTGPVVTSAAAAPVEYPRHIYLFARIDGMNASVVSFELTTPFDLEGVAIPGRKVYPYTCSWAYQGAAIDTPFVGGGVGACSWLSTSNNNGVNAYFDSNNNLLVGGVTVATIPASTSAQADGIYKVAKSGLRRKELNGTTTIDNSKFDFYQVKTAGSTAFRKARVYTDWNSGTGYFAYIESEYGDLVKHNNKIWLCIRSHSSNKAPQTNQDYWRRVDVCGKKLESCAIRYKSKAAAAAITGVSETVVSTTQDPSRSLPYGGFPSSKRYNY